MEIEGQPSKGTKRNAEKSDDQRKKKGINNAQQDPQAEEDEIEFEDPYEDEIEEEELVENADEEEDAPVDDVDARNRKEISKVEEYYREMTEEEEKMKVIKMNTKVFRPGIDKLEEDEVLEHDPEAYIVLHQLETDSCLSFDMVPDKLGFQRTKFPMTCYWVTGTQAEKFNENKIYVMKASNIHKTLEDSDNEDDDFEDEDPELEFRMIPHPGSVNRIKIMPQAPNVCATWSEDSNVYLWDVMDHVKALDTPPSGKLPVDPIKKLSHKTEGFALSWSVNKPGRLLSGDCDKKIYLTELHSNSLWVQDTTPFTGHKSSVEDLQWSPTEAEVFASCSADKTVKIWDTRMKQQAAMSFKAADCDVNVISWNSKISYLLASGADDGSFSIWDLRTLAKNECTSVAHFKYHTDQITSIEWNPNEESVIAASGADGQVTIWDLSLENDTEAENADPELAEFPPQLLFVHQGQVDTKEVHWHPQIPDLVFSTAEDGFNIFKPNIEVGPEEI